jgi:membrane protein DedA with SNARE-associated domain/membrane-associated phospholipid phosphatase
VLAETLSSVLSWIEHHPHWAYLAVCLIAAGESLVVVGLIVPGVALMFGVGALVAVGALDLGPVLLFAALGAALGDSLSFWIGRHFRQRLRLVWPFNRHEGLLDRGIEFFHRHGAKSVVLARFVGPLRPIVPAVAGMLDMPPRRFFAANVSSALLWAPAYTLPGVVFGASLALAAEVAGKLAALLVVAVCVLWFGLWIVRIVIRFLQPRAGALTARVLDWGRRHPLLQPLAAAVLDPDHPEAKGLAVLLILLGIATVVGTWLSSGLLAGLDLYVHAGLQELRNPAADRAMVLITEAGHNFLILTVLGAGCAWLLLRGRLHAAFHWIAAAGAAGLLTLLLNLAQALPRAAEPDGHVSLSIAVYGFLAVLVARELSAARRWMAYVGAALFTIPIAFSRLYLGAQWLSEILAGMGVGLACVALFGIAYRRHPARALQWPALVLVAGAALVVIGTWRAGERLEAQLLRYAQAREPRTLHAADWLAQGWRRLPVLRNDFRARGRQALSLQYAGELATLRDRLVEQGWRAPPPLSARTALLWLSPQPVLDELPVLPQVHDGQYDALRLVRHGADGTVYILRVWPTRWRLGPQGLRLWVGSTTELELRQRMNLFSYTVTGREDVDAFSVLQRDLASKCAIHVRPRQHAASVLLARCDAP